MDKDQKSIYSGAGPENKALAGFTFLEILIIVVIFGFLVSMMTAVFAKGGNQRRFDETRRQMEKIKEAILGSPGPYVATLYGKGRRSFAGYAPDMGELPSLIDGQPEALWTDDPDDDGAADFPAWEFRMHRAPAYTDDRDEWGTFMGWRGPYIEKPRGDVFKDGWGNPLVFHKDTPLAGDMTIESYGADGFDDSGGEKGFDEDVNLVIQKAEYMAPVAGYINMDRVQYKDRVKLIIYYPSNGEPMESIITVIDMNSGAFRFQNGAAGPYGDFDGDIPVGERFMIAWEDIDDDNKPGDSFDTREKIARVLFRVKPGFNWVGVLAVDGRDSLNPGFF